MYQVTATTNHNQLNIGLNTLRNAVKFSLNNVSLIEFTMQKVYPSEEKYKCKYAWKERKIPWKLWEIPSAEEDLCKATIQNRSDLAWEHAKPMKIKFTQEKFICFVIQTFMETRLTEFFKMKPKQCFENWGQETSTCSSWANNLVLLDLTGFITEIKLFDRFVLSWLR